MGGITGRKRRHCGKAIGAPSSEVAYRSTRRAQDPGLDGSGCHAVIGAPPRTCNDPPQAPFLIKRLHSNYSSLIGGGFHWNHREVPPRALGAGLACMRVPARGGYDAFFLGADLFRSAHGSGHSVPAVVPLEPVAGRKITGSTSWKCVSSQGCAGASASPESSESSTSTADPGAKLKATPSLPAG
jgi:hypothetical protein